VQLRTGQVVGVWVVGCLGAGCTSLVYNPPPECPFDDAPSASVGFTPDEVVAAAAVTWSGDATTLNAVPEVLPVTVASSFERQGDARVVDFGTPADAACPAGLALYVPVVHHVVGTLDGDAFVQELRYEALIATSADASAMSLVHVEEGYEGLGSQTQATVDPGIEALGEASDFLADQRAQGVDCDAPVGSDKGETNGYWIGVQRTEYAGSWARTYDDGALERHCTKSAGTIARWGDGLY
jgi:hypothetical protein